MSTARPTPTTPPSGATPDRPFAAALPLTLPFALGSMFLVLQPAHAAPASGEAVTKPGWSYTTLYKGERTSQKVVIPLKAEGGKPLNLTGRMIRSQWLQYRTNAEGKPVLPTREGRVKIKDNLVIAQLYLPQADGKGVSVDQRVFEFTKAQAKAFGPRGMVQLMALLSSHPVIGRPIGGEELRGRMALQQAVALATTTHFRRDQIKIKDLYAGAIAGVVSQLPDHYSYSVHPDRAVQQQQHSHGSAVGIGVVMSATPVDRKAKPWRRGQGLPEDTPATVTVNSTVPGAPAERAGLRAGDIFVSVDGAAVSSIKAAADLLRGQEGTVAEITVRRNGRIKQLQVERKTYDPNPITAKLRENVAYVKLPSFDTKALAKVQGALEKMVTDNKRPLQGVVLDFRGNPGGELYNAVGIANLFVKEGTLLELKGYKGSNAEHFEADPKKAPFAHLPLVFLVDKDSYSASELTAGALQDIGRAMVLGDRSGGKGTKMTVRPLVNGGLFALIDGQYHFRSGASPQETGLKPDVSSRTARSHSISRGAPVNADHVLEEAIHLLNKGKVPVQGTPKAAVAATDPQAGPAQAE